MNAPRGKTSPDSTGGSFKPATGQRSRVDTSDMEQRITVWAESGLMPAGEDPWPDDGWKPAPRWVGERYDAWGRTPAGELVVAKAITDETYVAVTTESGVICAEMRFPTPEGEMDEHIAAAQQAVLRAWLTTSG